METPKQRDERRALKALCPVVCKVPCATCLCRAQRVATSDEQAGMVLVQGWQDISSAPRDGTQILVWSTTREPHYADQRYIETICQGVHVEGVQTVRWIAEDGEWEQMYIGTPLFWMPLPPPPAKEPSDAD